MLTNNGESATADAPTMSKNRGEGISKLLTTRPKNVAITTEVMNDNSKSANQSLIT